MPTQQNKLITVRYEAPRGGSISNDEAVYAKIPASIQDRFLYKKKGTYKGLRALMINYNDKESLAYLENYLVLQHGFKRTIQIEVPVAMLKDYDYYYACPRSVGLLNNSVDVNIVYKERCPYYCQYSGEIHGPIIIKKKLQDINLLKADVFEQRIIVSTKGRELIEDNGITGFEFKEQCENQHDARIFYSASALHYIQGNIATLKGENICPHGVLFSPYETSYIIDNIEFNMGYDFYVVSKIYAKDENKIYYKRTPEVIVSSKFLHILLANKIPMYPLTFVNEYKYEPVITKQIETQLFPS